MFHRKTTRLQGYDYSQAGGYYVTIVAQGRECFFGEIHNDEMTLNDAGKMVAKWWNELPYKFPSATVDTFVIMPNHFHGIIIIHETVGATLVVARPGTAPERAGTRPAPTLGNIVGAFKSITTHEYIRGVKQSGWPPFVGKLWQRNYVSRAFCGVMNTSFVTNPITNASPITSHPTPPIEPRTRKTLP